MQINFLENTQVILSEIEKFCCMYVYNFPGVKESFLYSNFGISRDLLKKICHGLVQKRILKMDQVSGELFLADDYDGIDLTEFEMFSALTVVDPRSIIRLSRIELDRIVKEIHSLYQNGVDLYNFNYNKDALDKVLEILSLIKAKIIPDFEAYFHQLDVIIFGLLNAQFRTFTDDNCGMVVDYFLSLIFKILAWLKKNHPDTERYFEREQIKEMLNQQKGTFVEITELLCDFEKSKDKHDTTSRVDIPVINGYMVLFFHRKIGPTIYLERYPDLDPSLRDQITKIMDFRNSSVFSYTVGTNYTINLQFEIDSPIARGKKEYLQITIIFNERPASCEQKAGALLEAIAKHLQNIQDLYKIFYIQGDQCLIGDEISPSEFFRLKEEFSRSFRDLENLLEALS
jgi:hypothetical protein